ncbi:hypothetical protein PZ897_02275 [Hoeflea sp. YIM 152468]|uniref:hypothetical protein n=1 Tax=Hoeflea sp. YIM 152468 TaxID=3031759 RepID=UPI0023DA8129|nr:hypothetical protein [Hoeflea sp. YIM 152468]MDF1606996.1 hypothetical protein [Hoeflea sp. YIM 152468]
MSLSNSGFNRLAQVVLVIMVGFALSACAGRPKPLDPARPFNVTEVRVLPKNIEDFGFADRLQNRLSASVGRSTADIGEATVLRIVVLDRRTDFGPVSFFIGQTQSASLDLSLLDSESGHVLRSHVLRVGASGRQGEAVLISKLTDDIRTLLGLAGYTPFPVRGAKLPVVVPQSKPGTGAADELTDAALLSADPLLNGTLTPTSLVLDVAPDAAPSIDISRPLLDATPAIAAPAPKDAMAPPALVKLPNGLEIPAQTQTQTQTQEQEQAPAQTQTQAQIQAQTPAQAHVTDVGSGGSDVLDEPCIITLESDCVDPGSR